MHPKYQNNSKRGDSELHSSRFAQAEDYFNKALNDLDQDEEAQKLKYLEEQAYQFDPAFWGKILQEEIRIRKGLMQVYFGWFKDDEALKACFKLLSLIDNFYGYEHTDWTNPNQPLPRHAELEALLREIASNLSNIYARNGDAKQAALWLHAFDQPRLREERRRYKTLSGDWLYPDGKPFMNLPVFAKIRYDIAKSLSSFNAFSYAISVKAPYWCEGKAVSKAELWALRKIEQELHSDVEVDNEAIYVACVPCDTHRLFLYYSSDCQSTLKRIEQTAAGITSHQLTFESKLDTSWNAYKRWAAPYLPPDVPPAPELPVPPELPPTDPSEAALEFDESAIFAELWRLGCTIPAPQSRFSNLVGLTQRYRPSNRKQVQVVVDYFLKFLNSTEGWLHRDALVSLAFTLPRLDPIAAERVLDEYSLIEVDAGIKSNVDVSRIAQEAATINVPRGLALASKLDKYHQSIISIKIASDLVEKDPETALTILDQALELLVVVDSTTSEFHSADKDRADIHRLIDIAQLMKNLDFETSAKVASHALSLASKTEDTQRKWEQLYRILQLCVSADPRKAEFSDVFLECFKQIKRTNIDLQIRKNEGWFGSGPEMACWGHIKTAQVVARILPDESLGLLEAAVELTTQMNKKEDPIAALCRIVSVMKEINQEKAKEIFALSVQRARAIPITYMTIEAPKVGAAFKAVCLTRVLEVCPQDQHEIFAEIYQDCLDAIDKVKLANERFSSKLKFATSLVKVDATRGVALLASMVANSETLSLDQHIMVKCMAANIARAVRPEYTRKILLEALASSRTILDVNARYHALYGVLCFATPDCIDIANDLADEIVSLAIAMNLHVSDTYGLVRYLGAVKTNKCTRAAIRVIEFAEVERRSHWLNSLVTEVGKGPKESERSAGNELRSNWN